MRRQGISSWRGVHAGTCYAWPLPADATCATVARQEFRDAVAEVGLEPDLLEDCVLMASELAANTLHAQAVAGAGGGGDRLASVTADVEGEPITSAGPAPHAAPRGSVIPRARKAPPTPPAFPAPQGRRGRSASAGPAGRTLAVSARPRHRARTGLQGLRLLPRLAGWHSADGVRDVRRRRRRARAADRAPAVRRPVGSPPHPGQAGRLRTARQGRLVRGPRATGPCPADRT